MDETSERSREAIFPLMGDLFSDIDQEQSFVKLKPLLAHYTSVYVLEKIAQHEEIWLSNPLYMNDIEEVRFGINEGLAAFNNNPAIASALQNEKDVEYFQQCLAYCFQNFDQQHVFDTYILCLSEHDRSDEDGLLSMWRGYGDGGKGVALVFDGGNMSDVPSSPLIFAKVTYATTAERHAWFFRKAEQFAGLIVTNNIRQQEIAWATETLFARLRVFSLFTKHTGFAEEREWRIAYLPERDPSGLLKEFRSYCIGHRGVEPKLKLPIRPLEGATDPGVSLDALLHTVLLGPSLQAPLVVYSVKRMLELLNRHSMSNKVKASRIPFRATGIQF